MNILAIVAAFLTGVGLTSLVGVIVHLVRQDRRNAETIKQNAEEIAYLKDVLSRKRRTHEDSGYFWDAQAKNVAMKYLLEAEQERIQNQLFHLDRQNEILANALNRDTKKDKKS